MPLIVYSPFFKSVIFDEDDWGNRFIGLPFVCGNVKHRRLPTIAAVLMLLCLMPSNMLKA